MEWVKDGTVDATELWALDAYEGLPRIPLDRPVVSMDGRTLPRLLPPVQGPSYQL